MSKQVYTCPVCQNVLESRVCDHCDTDLDDVMRTLHIDNEAILAGLQGVGAYFDYSTRALTIPGDVVNRPFTITLNDEGSKFLTFASFVREAVGCSPKRFGRQDSIQFLKFLYKAWPRERLPFVLFAGDRPQLHLSKSEDRLYFPDVGHRPPLSQLLPVNESEDGAPLYMRYTGPPLTPQDHGGLTEEFIASCKCPDDENRAALRTWLYGSMIAGLVPPGQVPALLLAADNHGAGKSTTAETIAYILGGGLNVPWKDVRGEDDLNRRAMDQRYACLIADNLSNDGGDLIDDSHLAVFITTSQLSVKQMYVSTGSVSVPNYTKTIVTANQPALTGELLSRCVVVSLFEDMPGEEAWSDKWRRLRVPLLEDLMHHCIEGWRRGPFVCPTRTRFDTWHGLVSRVLQVPPVIVPEQTAVKAPIEFVLDKAVPQLEGDGPVTLSRLLTWMEGCRVGTAGAVCRQQRWTGARVVEDVRRYVRKYRVDGDVIRRSEA